MAVLQVLIKKNTWGLLKGSWWIELSSTHTQDGLCVDRVYKWLKAGHSSILCIKSKRLSSPNLIQTTYRQLTNIVLNITTQVMWCQFMLNAVTIGYSHTIKNSVIVHKTLNLLSIYSRSSITCIRFIVFVEL